jgi:hypothetical protein
LTAGEKFRNRVVSGVRIVVENVLCGVKRCRIVKETFRLTTAALSDVVMEIACGLHNLRVIFRHPLQTLDLTDLTDSFYFP